MTPEEHKKAFPCAAAGRVPADTEELMQQAVERAAQILESSPQVRGLMEACMKPTAWMQTTWKH